MISHQNNYIITIPPLICKVEPVMKLASSLARYIQPLAISSTSPNLLTGIFTIILLFCSSVSLSVIGVDINPGAIRLHVIPRAATSKAIDLVKPINADLEAE